MQKITLRFIIETLVCGFFTVLALLFITQEIDLISLSLITSTRLFITRNLLYMVLYVTLSVVALSLLDKAFNPDVKKIGYSSYLYFPVALYIALGFMTGSYFSFAIAAILGLMAHVIPKKFMKKQQRIDVVTPRVWVHLLYFIVMFILTFILAISRTY